jgi:hypothetical protein
MRFSATAAPSEQSNAVGRVELECGPDGLTIGYRGLGTFQAGYATGALARGADVLVPYSSLLEARVEGEALVLALEPQVLPHNRLRLVEIGVVVPEVVRELSRQRWLIALAALLVAVAVGLSTLVVLTRSGSMTLSAAWAVSLIGGALLVVTGAVAHRHAAWAPVDTRTARLMLAAELERYFPALTYSEAVRRRRPLALPTFEGALPRTTLAIVLLLTAAALSAVLMARWLLSNPEAPLVAARSAESRGPLLPAREQQGEIAFGRPAPEAATQAPSVPLRTAEVPSPPRSANTPKGSCECQRAASPLWDQPIPQLSVLVLSSYARQRGSRRYVIADIGVVNNGQVALSELTLQVHFSLETEGQRRRTEDKPLYFEGPLSAGQAIKWRVEGEGTAFEVENPIVGQLDPRGADAAPADRFEALLSANHRPVRMHGAMMLAYLGDSRAKGAVLALQDAIFDNEAPYLERLQRALNPVRACQLQVTPTGSRRHLVACVHNTTTLAVQGYGVKWRALDRAFSRHLPVGEPPLVLQEAITALPGELTAQSGLWVEADLQLEGAEAPAAFEVYADRADLLR